MINALDLLRHRLSGMPSGMPSGTPYENALPNEPGPSMSPEEMQMYGSILPDWLPEAVRRQILGQPSYPEREPSPAPINPGFYAERNASKGGQGRHIPLVEDLGYGSYQQGGRPLIEGDRTPPPSGMPYASPLNQMFRAGRRPPWALY